MFVFLWLGRDVTNLLTACNSVWTPGVELEKVGLLIAGIVVPVVVCMCVRERGDVCL